MSADFAKFDKRNYPTFDVIEGYRQGAPLYDEMVPGRLDLPLLESIRSIVWKDVEQCVDLGCGSGRIGVWLKEARGIPAIDGVDLSPDMLALAQQKNAYRSIVKGDVCDSGLESTRYDLGVSVLATCHMADLGTFYGEAARLLKRNGHFIQIDFHPFFLVNGIPTHFPKPDGSIVAIKNFVHL
ncbi:MAG TPA: class I SAM-dependent methyltransferase, partial [Planctomycetota bacterium]|nr:class I SAM-dependent methyltransferase [Planctomycetota bacterium]